MKTFLITGGAGFIGSNFVHYLYDKYPNYRILILDLLTYAGSLENLPGALSKGADNGRLQFWYGDVRNGQLVPYTDERIDRMGPSVIAATANLCQVIDKARKPAGAMVKSGEQPPD